MQIPLMHKMEVERLASLKSYHILDSESELEFDNLTSLAAEICETPISLITLIDYDRQWFKSKVGIAINETSRDYSMCGHAINEASEMLIVEDARINSRFADNPFVIGDPNIIFYAGIVLKDENGLPLGSICVADQKPRNISEKQINALKSISKQIMHLLNLKKSQRILEELKIKLEEKNEQLDRFAAVAAHDLKSPLANISSLTNLFYEIYGAQLDEKGKILLDSIGNSGLRLRGLIDGLLQFSKIDDISTLPKSTIDLNKLKNELCLLLGHQDELNITLNSNLDSIYSYPLLIDQILINLFSNALKYNDKDVVEIDFSVSENTSHYLFIVKDNGIGIAKKYHAKIFNIFQVASIKDRYGNRGSGIGLATVKKVIEKLGGDIRLESEEGQGAQFIFSIAKLDSNTA